MGWIRDEFLFYGGIAVAAGDLIMAIICFCILQVRKIHLKFRLDEEYGRKEEAEGDG